MANVINLPTYEQVENMGTGWDNYTPFSNYYYIPANSLPEPPQYHLIYEVTGGGYLSKVVAYGSVEINVSIDGQVVYNSNSGGSSTVGIIDENQLIGTNANGVPLVLLGDGTSRALDNIGKSNYPEVLGAVASIVLTQPLFFKESLKVELRKTGTTNNRCAVAGGFAL